MSSFNYYYWRLKALLFKLETTSGTDPIPTAAANGVLSQNFQITIQGDKLERVVDRAFFAANPYVLINRRVEIEFDFDPLGASGVGTTAPISPIMQACGHSETLVASTSSTFAPVSTALKSATMYFYWFDNLVNVNECRGSVSFDSTINQWDKAHAKFTGLFAIPTASSNITPVLTTWRDGAVPAVTQATMLLTINSITVNAKMFTLDENGVIQIEEGSEFRDILLTNRAPGGTVRFYMPGASTFDLFSIASAHTRVPVACTIDGGASLKRVTTIPNAQFEMPKFVNVDDTVCIEASYTALPSTAGNDEYSMAFT
jgi:hypothetical protein